MQRVMMAALAAGALFAGMATVHTAEAFPAGKVQAPATGSLVTDIGRGHGGGGGGGPGGGPGHGGGAPAGQDTAPDPAGAAVADTTTTVMATVGSASMGIRSWAMAPTTMAMAVTAKGVAGCAGAHSPPAAATGGRAMRTALTTTIN